MVLAAEESQETTLAGLHFGCYGPDRPGCRGQLLSKVTQPVPASPGSSHDRSSSLRLFLSQFQLASYTELQFRGSSKRVSVIPGLGPHPYPMTTGWIRGAADKLPWELWPRAYSTVGVVLCVFSLCHLDSPKRSHKVSTALPALPTRALRLCGLTSLRSQPA